MCSSPTPLTAKLDPRGCSVQRATYNSIGVAGLTSLESLNLANCHVNSAGNGALTGHGRTRLSWQGTTSEYPGRARPGAARVWGAALPACGATVPSQSDIPRGTVSSRHGSGRRSPLADIAEPQRMQSLQSCCGESQRSGRAELSTRGVARVSSRECVGLARVRLGVPTCAATPLTPLIGHVPASAVSQHCEPAAIDGVLVPCAPEASVRTARRAVL